MSAAADRASHASPFSGLLAFTARAAIVILLVAIAIAALIPDVSGSLKRELRTDETRIRLSGFFTTNPYVHLKVAQIKEQKGDLRAALDELELAVSLFDLHAPESAARQQYVARRDELRQKLAQQK